MTACREIEPLLTLRAVHALDAGEAREVEAHLAACARCRAEAAADEEALSLARLPPIAEHERRALRQLPERTLEQLQGREGGRFARRRLAAALAAAAAVVLGVLAPAVLRQTPAPPPAGAAQQVAEWQGPDLDTVWSDSALLDYDSSASTGGDASDAVIAAVDVTDGSP